MKKRDKSKANDNRFDQDAEIYVGPSSLPLSLSKISQSPYLTQNPAPLDLSHTLSPSSLSTLARRCSTRSIQDDVKELIEDEEVLGALRKRMLAWDEAEEVNRKKSKRTVVKEDDEEVLRVVDETVPDALRITTIPRLSAYAHREGLREQSCIKGAVSSALLRNPKQVTLDVESSVDHRDNNGNEKAGKDLVLSISVYGRVVRGMWSKERVQQTLGKAAASMEEGESESSSVATKEMEGSKIKKSERSLYNSLQLLQKVEILSTSTLQQLRDAIFCRMEDLPEKILGKEGLPQYTGQKRCTDSCFLIEDLLYSETPGQDDYAALLERSIPAKPSLQSLQNIKLDSILLRTGKLYWFLHQGSCEHLWTITSIRAMRKNENNESFPMTTYLASAAAIHPLAKWTQTKLGGNRFSYTLDKCDLCKGNQASMILAGGSRFQSHSPTNTTINGLKQDTSCICHNCWAALRGKKPFTIAELVQRAGEDASLLPLDMPPIETNSKWTLIPVLE